MRKLVFTVDIRDRHLGGIHVIQISVGAVSQVEDGKPIGAALSFEGTVQQRRGRADTWTKIAFQYYARRAPLLYEELSSAVLREGMDDVRDSEGVGCNGS